MLTYVIFEKNAQSKLSPNRRKLAQSGHPDRQRLGIQIVAAAKEKKHIFLFSFFPFLISCFWLVRFVPLLVCAFVCPAALQGDQMGW
jgi:hypothetical protein